MHEKLAKYLYLLTQTLRGDRVLRYLRELEKTQWYSHEQIEQLQLTKLKRILHHAYSNVPYYRRKFEQVGLLPSDINTYEDLLNIPPLTKHDIREYSDELVDRNHRYHLRAYETSGSTGVPLTLLKDTRATAYAQAVMYRGYRWHGLDIGSKQARFWGIPISIKGKMAEYLKDIVANRRRFSVFSLDNEALNRYVKRLKGLRPEYLYGYTSALVRLAQFVTEEKIDLFCLSLKAMISTSEVLYKPQRKLMQQAFACPVVNEYGAVETGIIALECPEGRMHIMADNLIVEFIKHNKHVHAGQEGEIVVTTLNSLAVPLIRYRLGDLGKPSDEICPCDRKLPCIEVVIGRTRDLVRAANGRLVHGAIFHYIFKELVTSRKEVRQFRVIQKAQDELLVQLSTTHLFKKANEKYLEEKLHRFLGDDLNIDFEYLSEIPRERSGKLRHFVSEISTDLYSPAHAPKGRS